MTSIIKVDNIQDQGGSATLTKCGTTITIGASGDTIALAAGASQTGFGASGAVNWDTTAKTTTVTSVSGNGYFINTTAGAVTVNLPVGVAGAIVSLADYANTWQTNAVTVTPNGSEKINGGVGSIILNTEGQSLTLLYVDATEGWKSVQDSTTSPIGNNFVAATGGTESFSGDYKIHTFTGPGTFTVTSAGNPAGSNTVDYLVVAGGGGSNGQYVGGAGGGGFRESKATGAPWTASPLATCASIPVSITGYPIIIGGGGTNPGGASTAGSPGITSSALGITSTGGGGGAVGTSPSPIACAVGKPGGSGGGAGGFGPGTRAGGAGNTPPVRCSWFSSRISWKFRCSWWGRWKRSTNFNIRISYLLCRWWRRWNMGCYTSRCRWRIGWWCDWFI